MSWIKLTLLIVTDQGECIFIKQEYICDAVPMELTTGVYFLYTVFRYNSM